MTRFLAFRVSKSLMSRFSDSKSRVLLDNTECKPMKKINKLEVLVAKCYFWENLVEKKLGGIHQWGIFRGEFTRGNSPGRISRTPLKESHGNEEIKLGLT